MSIFDAAVINFIDRKLTQPAKPRKVIAQRNLAKGIVAGLAAGLVATAAKTLVEKVYPPRTHGEPEPPAALAEKVAGHELAPVPKAVASESIHWVFGATAGVAYGALAEYYPAATSRDGIGFGLTLMALTHESALPAMGISQAPAAQSTRERTSEMASHIVYGLVAETTRRIVRKML
jgi:putative membrane protein